ncbi:MAG: peptidoglycan-binding domain-containing protein, partial [Proteobacteria bacterium]|nr:peptidoglycan-binding domain-containing protein [Pseudomonadota bacterium]
KAASKQSREPAKAGSVQAGQPAKAASKQSREPAKAGSVQAGQPAKAASKQSREPAKAGSGLSSAQFMIGGKRSSAAARGPAGRQRARTPDDGSDARLRVAEIQRALKKIGFDPGPIDNVAGVRTRKAILAYQRNYGIKLDGKASLELLRHLRKASLELLLRMKRINGARRSGANR